MAADDNSSGGFPWTPLVTLLVASSGLLLLIPHLNSSRPSSSGLERAEPSYQDEDVEARLWQDPIAAVDAATKDADLSVTGPHSIQSLEDDIRRRQKGDIDVRRGPWLRILAVMTPGDRYVEDCETRLRDREAVIQALGVARYTPEFTHRIGYVNIDWSQVTWSPAGISKGSMLTIPYEWYVAYGNEASHVLVLWLVDEAFQDQPLHDLGNLFYNFEDKGYIPEIDVVGPANSTTLESMVHEARVIETGTADFAEGQWLRTTHIYSARPDAEEEILAGKKSRDQNIILATGSTSEQVIKNLGAKVKTAGKFGLSLTRTGLQDDTIVGALFNELERRDVFRKSTKPSKLTPSHIVIISESDTLHARALKETFEDEFDAVVEGDAKKYIHSFVYLRGLDGKFPQAGSATSPTPGNPADSSAAGKDNTGQDEGQQQPYRQIGRPEQTEGTDHADYLRRLGEELAFLDAKLYKRGGIRAVGVLGSDVYDKLEILEALRPKVPRAIYFTNEVDARFAHSAEYPEARNLIIASDYALELSPTYQHGVLPFRDSGQTAVFAATEEALNVHPNPSKARDTLKPRIFEVAKSGLWDLSPNNFDGTGIQPSRRDLDQYRFWDQRWPQIGPYRAPWTTVHGASRRQWIGRLSAGIVLLFVLSFLYYNVRRLVGRECFLREVKVLFRYRPLMICLALAISVYFVSGNPALDNEATYAQGKPLVMMNGISTWIPMVLFVFSWLISLYLIFAADMDLQENAAKIEEEFGLGPKKDKLVEDPGKATLIKSLGGILYRLDSWKKEKSNEPIKAWRLWREYRFRGSFVARIARVSVMLVIFMLVQNAIRGAMGLPDAQWPTRHAINQDEKPDAGPWLVSRVESGFKDAVSWVVLKSFNYHMHGLREDSLMIIYFFLGSWVPYALMFYVLDAAKLNVSLIQDLGAGKTEWPIKLGQAWDPNVKQDRNRSPLGFPERLIRLYSKTMAGSAPEAGGKKANDTLVEKFENWWFDSPPPPRDRPALTETQEYCRYYLPYYLDLLLFAKRTDAVNHLIYYPFVFIALDIVARLPVFDYFVWDQPMAWSLGICLGITLYAAVLVPQTACKYRDEVVRYFRDEKLNAVAEGKNRLAETIELTISEIGDLEQGAFVSIWQQPVVRAFLLPSGGVGIWTLLQFLPR